MTQVKTLLAKLDQMTMRERIIVACAGVIVISMSWYLLFGEATVKQNKKMSAQLNAAQSQLVDIKLRVEQQAQAQGAQTNPGDKLIELKNRTTAVEEKIQNYAAELISPTEMARLLEKVLERRSALRLIRLRNFGAEDLLPAESPGQNRLYRHGLELELEGPYLAVLAYLEDLEALPWRLYWQVLEIETDQYPSNRIRIEVATLSLEEDWIGV